MPGNAPLDTMSASADANADKHDCVPGSASPAGGGSNLAGVGKETFPACYILHYTTFRPAGDDVTGSNDMGIVLANGSLKPEKYLPHPTLCSDKTLDSSSVGGIKPGTISKDVSIPPPPHALNQGPEVYLGTSGDRLGSREAGACPDTPQEVLKKDKHKIRKQNSVNYEFII